MGRVQSSRLVVSGCHSGEKSGRTSLGASTGNWVIWANAWRRVARRVGTGERTPHLDPHARGAWVGLGLHHTRSHLMRAALEGVAFSLRQGLEALKATGVKVTELRLAGGGTQEMPWKQLLADVFGIPLYATTVAAASARGAALFAGIGIGVCTDANATLKLTTTPTLAATPGEFEPTLTEAWTRFQALYPQLKSLSLTNS
jgi:xylulokinase